jgi:hypothetical protein
VTVQTEITAGFGPAVRERRERVQNLRERARELYRGWADVFGPRDTPVPIDVPWDHTHCALQRIQKPDADDRLDLAETRLNEAAFIVEAEGGDPA